MVKAVFLDRDGTINRAFVRGGSRTRRRRSTSSSFSGAVAACGILKEAGFVLVIATNQPDVDGAQRTRGGGRDSCVRARATADRPH